MKIRKAVLPAAGLGTRFLPATKAQPKEMLPLVDKPLIQYVVEESVGAGITDVIIVTGRGKSAIEDHFDVSFELEHFLEEKDKREELDIVRAISDLVSVAYVRQKEASASVTPYRWRSLSSETSPLPCCSGTTSSTPPCPAFARWWKSSRKCKRPCSPS